MSRAPEGGTSSRRGVHPLQPGDGAEADQLAMYIVREVGYDLRAARKIFNRMARAKQRAAAQRHGRKSVS